MNKTIIKDKEELRDIILSIQDITIEDNKDKMENFNDYYDYSSITDMFYMFFECNSLKTIPQLDTSKVTDMSGMFCYCFSLETIPLLDTSRVTNMERMFCYCGSLKKLPKYTKEELIERIKMLNQKKLNKFQIETYKRIEIEKIEEILLGIIEDLNS